MKSIHIFSIKSSIFIQIQLSVTTHSFKYIESIHNKKNSIAQKNNKRLSFELYKYVLKTTISEHKASRMKFLNMEM